MSNIPVELKLQDNTCENPKWSYLREESSGVSEKFS
jgi:hypothetical protein